MTEIGLTSIRTTGDKIEIVNQLLLPHTVEFIEIDSIEKAHEAIKSMKVCESIPLPPPTLEITLSRFGEPLQLLHSRR